uniref:Uncharacterized protein n=1 Tax=Sphaerodactylus townsendi TaxID=933632 RepID=A0ACB8EG63_9SAUR
MNRGPQLIAFTRAQEESDRWRDGHVQKKSRRVPPVAGQAEENAEGETARNFYESLLLSSDPGKASPRKHKVRSARPPAQEASHSQTDPAQTDTRKGNQLLKAAQEGNLKALQALVEKDRCDVNYRDDYYWTATMCAAYAGQTEAVRYLLNHGAAWVGVCETQGRDAVDLAEEAGHQAVVEVLRESERPCVKQEPTR